MKAFALVTLLALAACQTTGSGNFCDLASPVRLTPSQIDGLTDAQVKQLLAHNLKGQKICGWKK